MPIHSAAFLDQCADGFTSKGQVALYQACIGRALAYVQVLKSDVAVADGGFGLGAGTHQIPFMVREILLLCFSCLDSSIHLLHKDNLLIADLNKTKFMAPPFLEEHFTKPNGDLLDPWKDVAEHYALDEKGDKRFKTNHLWNTLKHRGMLTMRIALREDGSPILIFSSIEDLNVVTFLDDFCGKVKAWVDKLSEKVNRHQTFGFPCDNPTRSV
mmetsp:Transcript_12849/g.20929  ORF Transcript_12849/g.20929 Transcript_12849/m.20929 type:complete len:213 (-) Transcript_12849:272-910(-)